MEHSQCAKISPDTIPDMKSAQTAGFPVAEMDSLQVERLALVERVVLSQTFQKTQKLREFLQFVCDCSIRRGLGEDVKEQQIGVHVFHRRPDYNTSEDSIVRVQARELRKRLTTYFETEGKNEPVVITIPKGGYLPVFVSSVSMDQAERESSTNQAERESARGLESEAELISRNGSVAGRASAAHRHPAQWAIMALGGVLLFVGGWEMRKILPATSQATATQQLYSFYEPLLGPIGRTDSNTLLVLSNPKVLLYAGIDSLGTNDKPLRSSLVPVPPELGKQLADARNLGEDVSQPVYLEIQNSTYTGMGEAANAYNIGRIMSLMGRSVRLTQGRFLNWGTAMRENLIVLGNPDINAWTHGNLASSNFVFVMNGIRNSTPLPGEKPVYEISLNSIGHPVEDYGLVSMSTSASGSRVLILAGRTSAGTYGTGDFFTNPDKMRIAYEKLSDMTQGKPFPKNWEVLIRIKIRDDIPVDTTLVTVRLTDSPR